MIDCVVLYDDNNNRNNEYYVMLLIYIYMILIILVTYLTNGRVSHIRLINDSLILDLNNDGLTTTQLSL